MEEIIRFMEQITLNSETMAEAVRKAAEVLKTGRAVLYPTDTLYGLGADAFSNAAVDNIYEIKGRNEKKPIHCIVADMGMAGEYADISNDALLLAKEFFPGALTLILKKKPNVQTGIARNISTIGIRIPSNDFCIALAREFGRPFTGTSANAAGELPQRSIKETFSQLGSPSEIIDLVVDAGELPASLPSTVVDLSGRRPVILREGEIPAADIWNVVRREFEDD